ncbi:MAG TPA: nitrilase-related carbon-nitrogen hydrolase [Candidatus Syntrophosphaera sp.]|jgi:predicted amidohydrolase|nr:nitrilase-related carbon-nitrogen hydrolase [Candidatus Syntrophosphaera sp.]
MSYRVSVLQFEPRLLDLKANLARLERLLRDVETDLVVLPELCTSGYVFASREETESVSESIPDGPAFGLISALAWERKCSVVYGFAERDGSRLYNSCALVNPDGSHHLYRKTHLFNREKLFFSSGNTGLKVSPAKDGVKVGLMVCFDWQFPEAARTLALKGAQIICHPSNLVLPWCQQAMITRSLENRVFSITANRTGTETNGGENLTFTGQSQILGTKGEILIRLNESETKLATCEIDPAEALDKSVTPRNDAFADRRPEFYEL